MDKQEEYFREIIKRQLESAGLSPKEVEKGLIEAEEFTNGLDEVLDSMLPVVPMPDPIDDTDADRFQLGAILKS